MLRAVFRTTERVDPGRQRYGECRHGNLRRQPDRTGRQDGRVRQRRFRGPHGGRGGRAGAEVTKIERAFGEVFSADEVAEAVKRVVPKVVGIVHAETSTGALAAVGRNRQGRA